MGNLLVGLIVSSLQPKKPSIKTTRLDKQALMQISGYLRGNSHFAGSLTDLRSCV
ncbi:hypothetical protein BTN49_0577 [Candidatus Enterovibrio escicola]|uniref:Uncharacterized protein n=1 Tax=Candidatus Enterovibrio escicola TaxID=1927127 RepID=A0A2A5T652_9GAMM|nr:hypothetical protein [Candidatus Enterovibrio escacola]PCS23608.1 hypothetical protein BTN49_0577 [Candidatus Enterovibrio escacola]